MLHGKWQDAFRHQVHYYCKTNFPNKTNNFHIFAIFSRKTCRG
nr:MAG TPA: hypothetical protein [Caudoviricetes sp.]